MSVWVIALRVRVCRIQNKLSWHIGHLIKAVVAVSNFPFQSESSLCPRILAVSP